MIRYEEQSVRSNIGDKEERQLRLEFAASSPKNNEVSFFCYLLIDPTMLPEGSQCTFRRFVAAIFYVGKGNRSRPLQHLKDASKCHPTVDKGLIEVRPAAQRLPCPAPGEPVKLKRAWTEIVELCGLSSVAV